MRVLQLYKKNPRSESGAILIFLAILLVVLVGMLSLSIDIGHAYLETRRLQTALDAGSVAAANLLTVTTIPNPNDPNFQATLNEIKNRAWQVSEANGAKAAELDLADGIQLGFWDNNTLEFDSISPPRYNAVSITARRVVPTFFGSLFGVASFIPPASSIALVAEAQSVPCPIPFGITVSSLDNGNNNFTISSADEAITPANWGKLQLADDRPVETDGEFAREMTSFDCTPIPVAAQLDSAGTNSVAQGLSDRCYQNPLVTLPVVQHFPTDPNTKAVVYGFVLAKIVSDCDLTDSTAGGEIPKNRPGEGEGEPNPTSNHEWSMDFELLPAPIGTSPTNNPPQLPFAYVLGLAR